ncbi:MAG TPA: hypothetical protein VE136_15335 [Anaerolineales bacterium]|jgi:hypothetical protein|nr:hypothetical protein [Anaerolineales bacterium]
MSDQEKFDEKEAEKREEKSPQEKSWDEKWRRDPLGTLTWAAIFIWAGLVLLANNLGYFQTAGSFLAGVQAWSLIFLGAGVLVLLEVLARLLFPEYRRGVTGSIIFGFILVGIGLGDIFSWELVWPFILIALGLSIVLRGVFRRS